MGGFVCLLIFIILVYQGISKKDSGSGSHSSGSTRTVYYVKGDRRTSGMTYEYYGDAEAEYFELRNRYPSESFFIEHKEV